MEITEKDIFDYIFFPDSLNPEKKKEIRRNPSYNGVIDHYRNMQETLENFEIPDSLEKKISEAVPEYKPLQTIILKKADPDRSAEIVKELNWAAADSINLKKQPFVISYIDEGGTYIARLQRLNKKNRLYIFSTEKEVLKNIKVEIQPSQETYFLEDNRSGLDLEGNMDIDSISIKVG